ncbi:MAG: hypothetical protein R3D53_08815 [Paracoccaceae bacterium]
MAFWVVPAVAGFMVVNFPMGRIFLGDGGAMRLAMCWPGWGLLVRAHSRR